jgi:hypothetical protein
MGAASGKVAAYLRAAGLRGRVNLLGLLIHIIQNSCSKTMPYIKARHPPNRLSALVPVPGLHLFFTEIISQTEGRNRRKTLCSFRFVKMSGQSGNDPAVPSVLDYFPVNFEMSLGNRLRVVTRSDCACGISRPWKSALNPMLDRTG